MKKKTKKPITVKVPLTDIQKESVQQKVLAHLKADPKNAYTIGGILVDLYGYDAIALNAPFKEWPKGAPTQYTRVRHALERLKKEKLIESKKDGKRGLYWWKSTK